MRERVTGTSRWIIGLLAALLVGCTNGMPEAGDGGPGMVAAPFGATPEWRFPPRSMSSTRSDGGMVVTTDRVASEIGAEILRRGGNAVDAVIATHFALAVVNPEAGNIGGGGFLVAKMGDEAPVALDFREKAPGASTREMFLDENGEPNGKSTQGLLASGVPGSVAGMWEAHQRFGTLPWADLVEPAAALAEGIIVHERLAESLGSYRDRLAENPATAAAFLIDGEAPRVGERLVQADLARTLHRIANEGRDGFYRGQTAELIAAEMRRNGGIMTTADLAAYDAIWRDAVAVDYRGYSVVTMPPPSSGGATMGEVLNILEGYDIGAMPYHSAEHVHLMTEAIKRAFADRNFYLADPDFIEQPVAEMISEDYADRRRAEIRMDQATPADDAQPGMGEVGGRVSAAMNESPNTTHYSVVDRYGNAVAVTTTLNSLYGNSITVPGTGVLLNNEMDDFATRPGSPNMFGLIEGEANVVEPNKRMLSSMTPTLVLDPSGAVRLVTGSPGGPTIITTVLQTVSNVVDFGMTAEEAVAAPRLHHQHRPDVLRFEEGGLQDGVLSQLEAWGHEVDSRSGYSGDVQLILIQDGIAVGVSDPRRGGAAVGVTRRIEVYQ